MEGQDISCGIVPIRRNSGSIEVLLCKSGRRDMFVIPKGHKEPGETDIQTAIRELWEESGCRPIRFWSKNSWTDVFEEAEMLPELSYTIGKNGQSFMKIVKLFIAEVAQEGEIQDTEECEYVEWFPVCVATAEKLYFEQNKEFFIQHIMPKILN